MTPKQFLDIVVLPNLADANEDVSDVRRFHNALASVDALAAHIYYWCKENRSDEVTGLKDDGSFRMRCGANNGDVALIHDVAKALKHVELVRGNPRIKNAGEVQVRLFGWGEGGFGVGPFGGGPQLSVMVDGNKVQLHWKMEQVVDFYVKEMERLGIN